MKMRPPPFRSLLLQLALAATGLGLSAPASSAEAPAGTLRLGLIGPFTGPSSDFGIPMRNGAQLAIDEINTWGGYLGRKLELVLKDDGGSPETGLAKSHELAQEKVVAAVGFCNTGVALKSIEVFQKNKIPLIVPCATGTSIALQYKPADSYIFHTAARDELQTMFMVDDLVKRGWNRVAVFADTTGYGEGGLQDLTRALATYGLKPAHVTRFPLGVKNLDEELKAARAAKADVIFSITVGPENAVIARGRHALGWNVTQAGPWTLSFPFFLDGAREAAEGSLMALTFVAEPNNERRATFITSYLQKYGGGKIPVPMAAAQAYDAMYLMVNALMRVRDGRLTGPAIKHQLEDQERLHYGVVATYAKPFNLMDKEATSRNMLVMGVVRNGVITFAYPELGKKFASTPPRKQ